MATANQVIQAADELIAALQGLVDDGAYDAYRELLVGAVTDLAGAREEFANKYAGGTTKPGFAGVRTKLRSATTKAGSASPTDTSMRNLARSVDTAIAALRAA